LGTPYGFKRAHKLFYFRPKSPSGALREIKMLARQGGRIFSMARMGEFEGTARRTRRP
jgi:hypothetical protein